MPRPREKEDQTECERCHTVTHVSYRKKYDLNLCTVCASVVKRENGERPRKRQNYWNVGNV